VNHIYLIKIVSSGNSYTYNQPINHSILIPTYLLKNTGSDADRSSPSCGTGDQNLNLVWRSGVCPHCTVHWRTSWPNLPESHPPIHTVGQLFCIQVLCKLQLKASFYNKNREICLQQDGRLLSKTGNKKALDCL
jgi:hypothetical protein